MLTPQTWDFDSRPLVVIWEITRACALACKHCRAEAIPRRNPLELTTEEGYRLMDQVRELGSPVFVLTGGDPLMRPDFYDLIRYGSAIGLRVSASPSGTRLVRRQAMQRAAEAGLRRVSFSLDGASAETHDAFRRVRGSFGWTIDGIRYAREAGMEVQINTTLSRYSIGELDRIASLVADLGAVLWSVFFLVPVGRGAAEEVVSPEEHERVLHWLWELSGRAPFAVKTTEAPFYRRVALQRGGTLPTPAGPAGGSPFAPDMPLPGRLGSYGVNDARGFVFISHTGDVSPSGFLPLVAGNVRERPLGEIYRDAPLFKALRDPDLLKGKCGVCEYRYVCGGSRARAWAVTGDYLASDPFCAYIPPAARPTGAGEGAHSANARCSSASMAGRMSGSASKSGSQVAGSCSSARGRAAGGGLSRTPRSARRQA